MKLMTATAVAAILASAVAEAQERPSVAPKNMQAIAPALANYTDDVLFGDVWLRPELAPRDRSLVTVSVLISTGKTAQLKGHLNRALTNGVKHTEVAAVVTHLAFYSGWPNAVSALNVVEEVFGERKIEIAAPEPPRKVHATPSGERERVSGAAKLTQLINDVVVADLWRSPDLSPRDRSLVTIAALAANGDDAALELQIRRGLDNGLSTIQIDEALTHLAFYAGLPKATTAVEVAGKVFGSRPTGKTGDAPRLSVFEPNTEPRAAPVSNFTGEVSLASSFKGTGDSRIGGATVTFQPGARTHWHVHPIGQLLVVTDGEGWVQAEGEPVRAVKKGDVVWTAPGVKHWHGAKPTQAMTHVAASETSAGSTVRWLEPVTSGQYRER
ncbi:4-carboxymuconolactone decarboxylase [Povalibacter uvarum]|uniref:4-carboxymuconolactone decarboxylase n=1 Tax=Povalibacter uvarum TaxID=732238 RepID=A0A841HI63_9GAMM|nr:carboxymuconolactone decarboxylase family protein [Povalibacter uvarum]MBB6092393.1 4-carboxymuconolactone decarboxylase [Povalibacter uvarum]